jgi:hypothetical protein
MAALTEVWTASNARADYENFADFVPTNGEKIISILNVKTISGFPQVQICV